MSESVRELAAWLTIATHALTMIRDNGQAAIAGKQDIIDAIDSMERLAREALEVVPDWKSVARMG